MRRRWGCAAMAVLAGAAIWLHRPPRPDVPGPEALDPLRADRELAAFEAFLDAQGVSGVVPAWHLWRQGTDWRGLGHPPLAVPPRALWPGIVPTLRVLRDEVIPRVGPIEVVSGFRTYRYNQLAGGSPGSRHRWFEAVDVIPRAPWPRILLHARLRRWWRDTAAPVGLGLYARTRFHVDAWKHRTW